MNQNPYSRFKKEELILRNYLAADRTTLANERTLLAYIRTSVALAAAGGSLIHFLDSLIADIEGGLLLALAAGHPRLGVTTVHLVQTPSEEFLAKMKGAGRKVLFAFG